MDKVFDEAIAELERIVDFRSKDIDEPLNLDLWLPVLDYCRKNTELGLVLFLIDLLGDEDGKTDAELSKGE